jgi:hypothetical protein
MRENSIRFRLSDLELTKLQRLVATTGKVGMAEALRYLIDKDYDRDVLKLRPPCNKSEQNDRK